MTTLHSFKPAMETLGDDEPMVFKVDERTKQDMSTSRALVIGWLKRIATN